MSPFTDPCGEDLTLTLAPGQETRVHVAAGTIIACADGTILVRESATPGGDDWGVLRPPPRVPLAAGQVHRVEQAGVVFLHSLGGAQLYCVAPPAPVREFFAARLHAIAKWVNIFFFRRGVEQSGSSSGS